MKRRKNIYKKYEHHVCFTMLMGVGPSSKSHGLGSAFPVTTGLFYLFYDLFYGKKEIKYGEDKRHIYAHEKMLLNYHRHSSSHPLISVALLL
jgi:hypothetical protein